MSRVLYLDTSVVVKRYIVEQGATEVRALLQGEWIPGTSILTRVEMAAALAKATRVGVLSWDDAEVTLQNFLADWPQLHHLRVTDLLVELASELAWREGLRGYSATHLAAGMVWRDLLGEQVTMATFDRELWRAARRKGLEVWPQELT